MIKRALNKLWMCAPKTSNGMHGSNTLHTQLIGTQIKITLYLAWIQTHDSPVTVYKAAGLPIGQLAFQGKILNMIFSEFSLFIINTYKHRCILIFQEHLVMHRGRIICLCWIYYLYHNERSKFFSLNVNKPGPSLGMH